MWQFPLKLMDYASPSLLIKSPEPLPNSNQPFSGKQIQIHKSWGYPSKIDQIHLLSDYVVETKRQDKNRKNKKMFLLCAGTVW
jgi:hypothetical protein